MKEPKRLLRSSNNKLIAGVAAGLAKYFDTDVNLIRVLFILGAILGFSSTFWIYIILWLLLPSESSPSSNTETNIKNSVEEMKETATNVVNEVKEVVKGDNKNK